MVVSRESRIVKGIAGEKTGIYQVQICFQDDWLEAGLILY